jgi:undecaprenyl-diphosphatase
MSMKLATIWQYVRERRVLFGSDGVIVFLVLFVVLSCAYLLIELMDEVREGDTQTFDEWVLRKLRRADDLAMPVGPVWLREAGLDATALGSPLVLLLVLGGVTGFMWLQGKTGAMVLTLLASVTGTLVSVLLKYLVGRDRPTVVPRLQEVTTPSFPSGHAMLSAVIYLTLGILLAQVVKGRLSRLYCLSCAMTLTFLVGVSRIYLGVHYPTDVLAGWLAGLGWALLCWLGLRCLQKWGTSRTGLDNPDGSIAGSR